jgi:hypothetical protein
MIGFNRGTNGQADTPTAYAQRREPSETKKGKRKRA